MHHHHQPPPTTTHNNDDDDDDGRTVDGACPCVGCCCCGSRDGGGCGCNGGNCRGNHGVEEVSVHARRTHNERRAFERTFGFRWRCCAIGAVEVCSCNDSTDSTTSRKKQNPTKHILQSAHSFSVSSIRVACQPQTRRELSPSSSASTQL